MLLALPALGQQSPQVSYVQEPVWFSVRGFGDFLAVREAFRLLLRDLPTETGFAFVLVQHLDPSHQSSLSEILGRATTMPVREGTDGLPVEPNHVYVMVPICRAAEL
jgi:two-component system CheB/CheR fusion protein